MKLTDVCSCCMTRVLFMCMACVFVKCFLLGVTTYAKKLLEAFQLWIHFPYIACHNVMVDHSIITIIGCINSVCV